jgi:ankyrin repeat protein
VLAANKGDGAAMARLLAAGADPNALVTRPLPSRGKVRQGTALVVAARYGRLEAARLLLDAGADPSRANSDYATPLMIAAGNGHPDVLRLLLARGAAPDAVDPASGCTAFHFACFGNQPECAEVLARAGCDVGLKDGDGITGREVAEVEGHTAVVERLRAVVADQLRAAQVAAGPAPEPEAAAATAVVGDGGPADQLLKAANTGDGVAVARLLAAGVDPNTSMAGRTPSGKACQTTALCQAAGHGQLEAARLLLDAGADPSRANGDGRTPLMHTAVKGQLAVLRLLLARGAVVDTADPKFGRAAFHFACFGNHELCAEALARAGCDVGLKDKGGMTGRDIAGAQGRTAVVARLRAVVAEQLRAAQAVGHAPELEPAPVFVDGRPADQLEVAEEGDTAPVSRLLAAGGDPHASVTGRLPSGGLYQTTPLAVAAGGGQLEAVRLLLDGGADPSCAASGGPTPLMMAAGYGQLEVLRLLLARGVAVDAAHPDDSLTAFHHACFHNQLECAEALARAGCDVGLKDSEGKMGRELAEECGHTAVVERLRAVVGEQLRAVQLEAGPAPEPKLAAVTGDEGPADQLLVAVGKDDWEAVARLLAAGADPNSSVCMQTPSGKVLVQTTALFVAAAVGRLEAARLLLDAGADPSCANDDGGTPLMIAAGKGYLEVLRLLLARGAALDAADPADGFTAFHDACFENQPECAEALVRAGCDVGLTDSDGKTGRELAEEEGHAAVVARLRAVVADQLRAAGAVGPAPELEPEAEVGDGGLADQLLETVGNGDEAEMARLLAAGADPNASVAGRMPSGEIARTTPLFEAAGRGWAEAARVLLDAGADPDRANSDGTNPLMVAAQSGHLEVLRLLLGRGAALDAAHPATVCTAFHIACFGNHAECAEALARAGCDVGLKTMEGSTGQQLAEAQGSKEAVRRLRALARQPFVGVLVELAGLVGAAEHNGKRATVWCRAISCSLLHFVFCILHDALVRRITGVRGR